MGLAIIVPNISFNDTNLGRVTLSGNVPIRGLDINLTDSYTGTKVDLKCSYLPANTTQRNVVWSIESGSEYASISGSTLTILSNAKNNNVTIKCTSVSNPTVTAEKTIAVTYVSLPTPIYSIRNYDVNGDTSKIIVLDYNLLTGLPEWTFVFKATRNNDTLCNYFAITCTTPSNMTYNAGGIAMKNTGLLYCSTPHSVGAYLEVSLISLDAYNTKIALKCSNNVLFYSVDGRTWIDTSISVSSMNSLSNYDTPNLVLGGSRNNVSTQNPLQGSLSAYIFDTALDDVSTLL